MRGLRAPAVNCQPSYRGRALSTEPHVIKLSILINSAPIITLKNFGNIYSTHNVPETCIFQSKI